MKNPIVAGVVTSHDDPVLVAKRSQKQQRPVSTATSIGSSPSEMGDDDDVCYTSSSAKQKQKDAISNLLTPTAAYQHHYDEDDFHQKKESVSELVAKMERRI